MFRNLEIETTVIQRNGTRFKITNSEQLEMKRVEKIARPTRSADAAWHVNITIIIS